MRRRRVHRTARRGLRCAADLQEQSSGPFSGRPYCGTLQTFCTTEIISVAFCSEKAWRARPLQGVNQQSHFILGIRHQGVPDIEFFRALAPYFDVHSINDYNRYGHLQPAYAELYRATGKPMMITEFSFSGFPHRGHKSSLFVDLYTQENRSVGYRKYVLQAARAPFMIGMHWFMWMDYSKQDQSYTASHPTKM
jgi:hypothetical protein